MSDRASLMEAIETGDYAYLREEGWLEVYESLQDWFAGKQFSLRELTPYVDLVYDAPPKAIVEAMRKCIAESQFRPKPADVYRELQGTAAKKREARDSAKDRYGNKKRRDQLPEALARVRMLMEAGNKTCECMPRPVHLRIDRYGVLTCRECGCLEQGQANEAEDDMTEVEF